MARVSLTGIKPTGTPHLGNFTGAITPALKLADDPGTSSYYFIADYHALTTIHDQTEMRQLVREVAATWLACGLDPEKTVLYCQSDIPEVFELAWVLACFCPKGWMNKAHAYKAMVQKNRDAGQDADDLDAGVGMGLYTYPVLMAADIIIVDADLVPVGKDQIQHVELARDMAQRLNNTYGADVLKLPEAMVQGQDETLPGLDGRKMSKSYGNTLPLFVPAKKLKKAVNQIVTDSTPPEAPKDPASSTVFKIYEKVATPAQIEELRGRYAEGIGWGHAKAALFEVLDAQLSGPRAVYEELMAHPERIDEVLHDGAARVRTTAQAVLGRVREAIGIQR